jgi:steroid 5-alpha reductase family enzyme
MMLKEKNPKMWFLTNFFGINMMPTIFVYIAMIPAYFLIQSDSGMSPFIVAGFTICVISAALQLVSDTQMKRHRMLRTGKPIDTGLWRYSRHPNYFGEVMFWWGILIMTLGLDSAPLLRIAGAVCITGLFIFISIPMMEQHIQTKSPDYSDYKSRVSMLVPWKRKD